MAQRRHLYLICYDIAEDPKRLNRVARYLNRFAYRVQYSVFVGQFHERSLKPCCAA
ncbi:MAG: CRISPR-associated endonuclease Cas2 [Candidatus Competibacteraceae bacterium]